MIPLCGIALGIGIGLMVVWQILTKDTMPTQRDENELINKLNRMALDRNNKEGRHE